MAEPTRIPAFEIFKMYFAQFFDNVDLESSWLRDLYNSSQKYYDAGLSEADMPDLLLTDKDAPASYKERFKGIDMLRKAQAAGQNISHIPTVAEYAELSKLMKQDLNRYGLNDVANNDTIANIIGNDVDIYEMRDRLDNAFKAIDNADEFLKKELATNFPMLNRSDLAKALLVGKEGAVELQKKIGVAGVRAAAAEFGLQTQAAAEEIYKRGITRETARTGYQKVAEQMAGVTTAAAAFGGQQADVLKGLEQTEVLGAASGEIKRLKSQARAEFGGVSGAAAASLKKRQSSNI